MPPRDAAVVPGTARRRARGRRRADVRRRVRAVGKRRACWVPRCEAAKSWPSGLARGERAARMFIWQMHSRSDGAGKRLGC